MDINDTVWNCFENRSGNEFAKSGKYANVWLSLINDVENLGSVFSVVDGDMISFSFEVDREWLAGVGSRENESDNFVIVVEKGIKNWSFSFDTLSELLITKVNDFCHGGSYSSSSGKRSLLFLIYLS